MYDDFKQAKKQLKREKKALAKNLTLYIENDIKYKGPLGIIHMRAFAWFFILVAQLALIFNFCANHYSNHTYVVLSYICSFFGGLSLPCFLLASFGFILQNRKQFGKIVLGYFILTIGIAVAFYIVYFHYGVGIFYKFSEVDYNTVVEEFDKFVLEIFGQYLDFNVFLDLFLCSLFVYFLAGTPKKLFQGKKIIYFRLLALLPILYELAMMILKSLDSFNVLTLPAAIYPFLPTKAPLMFVAFIVITFSEYFRSKRFFNLGGTEEEHHEFFKTNKNSFLFARTTAITFAVCGLIDFITLIIFYYADSSLLPIIRSLKIGNSIDFLLLSPFVMLFSYNRIHKASRADILVPLIGIGAIVFAFVETFFQIIYAIQF